MAEQNRLLVPGACIQNARVQSGIASTSSIQKVLDTQVSQDGTTVDSPSTLPVDAANAGITHDLQAMRVFATVKSFVSIKSALKDASSCRANADFDTR
jgi:hypothetical protein